MSVQLVTMCLDIGREWRHTNKIDFSFYEVNLGTIVRLGLPVHVFASEKTLAQYKDAPNVIPHRFDLDDLHAMPFYPKCEEHWSDGKWRERFEWMKSSNAPERLLKDYCPLTLSKIDLMRTVAESVDPDTLLCWTDCHDIVGSFMPERYALFEPHIVNRIHLHWTKYDWANDELNGLLWSTMEPHTCPKDARPQMHLLAGIMLGRARAIIDFFPHYDDFRSRLLEGDLGTEQSILTAMYFRAPDKWFDVNKYPMLWMTLNR